MPTSKVTSREPDGPPPIKARETPKLSAADRSLSRQGLWASRAAQAAESRVGIFEKEREERSSRLVPASAMKAPSVRFQREKSRFGFDEPSESADFEEVQEEGDDDQGVYPAAGGGAGDEEDEPGDIVPISQLSRMIKQKSNVKAIAARSVQLMLDPKAKSTPSSRGIALRSEQTSMRPSAAAAEPSPEDSSESVLPDAALPRPYGSTRQGWAAGGGTRSRSFAHLAQNPKGGNTK
jgi:hypothetical protein